MAVPGNQGKTLHIAAMDGDTAAIQVRVGAVFSILLLITVLLISCTSIALSYK